MGQTNFGSKKILVEEILGQTKFCRQNVGSKQNFIQKKTVRQKNCGLKFCLGLTKMLVEICLG